MTRLPFGPEWGPVTRDDIVAEDDGPSMVDRLDNDPPAWRRSGPIPAPCPDCLLRLDHWPWCARVGGPGFARTFGLSESAEASAA